ncbi:MAG TPA: DUF6134 family protein, partial [Crenalkalicoccus sp.]|nr:DUF6134 family protein [Crenalkalicoccus sp.]
QGERLQRATSHLDRNGRITDMTAHAEGGAILITGPDGPQRLPADAAPLTWWNPHQAERPLFDNDSGKPLKLQWTRTPLEGGAYRLACTGDSESAGTYAANDTWLAWTTKGDDGSVVTYERI